MTVKQLERAALAAHRRGDPWEAFWQRHGDDVKAAEPWDRGKFRRLVAKLLCYVLCGDTGGLFPASDPEPWCTDDAADQAKPDDVRTTARCQLTFPSFHQPTGGVVF